MILPVAFLVAFSQIIVKVRSTSIEGVANTGFFSYLIKFISDPAVVAAYAASLLSSFAWLYVVSKLPLAVAFPIYIGITFVMVFLGGYFFLSEALTATKLVAALLIFSGIALGVTADA